jgi:drug/metabolite transporter (DMT)-like permease
VRPRDSAELLLLAAIWGASFLFMRIAAPAFGALPLAAVRVGGAALLLAPLLLLRGGGNALALAWRPVFIVGCINSALPFALYSYAALSITAGLASIFNATTPLWGALIAWLWLRDRPDAWRIAGLAIGFGGVVWLAWDQASFRPDAGGAATGWAVLACLAATFCYGLAANFTKRRLGGVHPLAIAAGSQVASTIALAAPAAAALPAVAVPPIAWAAAAALALPCTGMAYVLYFRLIRSVGPSRAMTVAYLIPVFAVAWGAFFLGEQITAKMVVACAVILLGTALATGLLSRQAPVQV